MTGVFGAKRTRRRESQTPLLYSGDHLNQREFHRRYEVYPDPRVKFELIGGIVYMMAPAGFEHGRSGFDICGILSMYEAATAGVVGVSGATVILGDSSEPQPDVALLIEPDCGGQTRLKQIKNKQYIEGPPELILEVSHSTVAIDLDAKLADYHRAGVREYVVVRLAERKIRWFDLSANKELSVDRKGILKSIVFPGLWIAVVALISRNSDRLVTTLKRGIKSKEHARFVKELAARRKQMTSAGTDPQGDHS